MALAVALLTVLAYFGSYFLLVGPGPGDAQNGVWFRMPAYRFEAEPGVFDPTAFYRFAHSVDQRFLSPSLWAGAYDPAAIMAAELGITGSPNTSQARSVNR